MIMAKSSGRAKPLAAKAGVTKVREGKLPKGEHTIGFKEFSWNLKTINDFKTKYWNK